MIEAPSDEGALLVSAAPPIGKAPGVTTGDGGGVVTEAVAVLVLGRRVLLRKRGTQPGTLEYNSGHIRIRRLGR